MHAFALLGLMKKGFLLKMEMVDEEAKILIEHFLLGFSNLYYKASIIS